MSLWQDRNREELIVTDRSGTAGRTDSSSGESRPGVATLESRREKLQTTQNAAAAADIEVGSPDEQLETNSRAELRATLDRVAMLKKAMKAATKERDELRFARKDARRVAAKAQQRAGTAEVRYDRAVLADMLRREKDHDLAAHTGANIATAGRSSNGRTTARTTRAAASRSGHGTSRARSATTRARSAPAEKSEPAVTSDALPRVCATAPDVRADFASEAAPRVRRGVRLDEVTQHGAPHHHSSRALAPVQRTLSDVHS